MTQAKSKPSILCRWILPWLAGGLISSTGCAAPRVVLVPPGQLIRLGPDCRGHVYVRAPAAGLAGGGGSGAASGGASGGGGEWTLSRNPVAIPEGWYAGPPPQ